MGSSKANTLNLLPSTLSLSLSEITKIRAQRYISPLKKSETDHYFVHIISVNGTSSESNNYRPIVILLLYEKYYKIYSEDVY